MTDPLDFLGLLVPPGFTRYCGSCGAVWGGCGCERRRVVGELNTPLPASVAEPDEPVVRYGIEICAVCDFPKEFCRGH